MSRSVLIPWVAVIFAAPLSFSQITFAPVAPYALPQLAQSEQSGCAVSADFNGDGRPDVAVCGSGGIWLFMNKGNGTFLSPFVIGTSASGLVAVDLNKDGHPDLVAVSGSTVQVYLNQGFGTFLAPTTYNLPLGPYYLPGIFGAYFYFGGMFAGDFNGDGKKDIAITNEQSGGGTVIYFGQGDGTLVQGTPFHVEALQQPYGDSQDLQAVGDVNGDGIDDLVIDTFDGGFQVFFGQRSGTVSAPAVYSFFDSYAAFHLADVNGDGKLDIVAGNQYSAFFVMLNDGSGAFGPATTVYPSNFGYGLPLSIGDFNKDGSNDVVSAINGMEYSFVNDGKGNFSGPTITSGFGTLYGFFHYPDIVADFDGDGLLDIASFDGSTLYIFKNTTIPLAATNFVTGFYPNNGGNSGTISVNVIGNGFPADIRVTLVGPGGTITPMTLAVSTAGNLITMSFDLTGVAPGTYTLVLSSSQGVVLFTQANAFTVQQGGSADIWTDLIGSASLRAGQPQTYYLLVGNRGNQDSGGGITAWISFPSYLTYTSPQNFAAGGSIQAGTSTSLFYEIAVPIPAGSTITIPITLTAPNTPQYAHQPFQLGAWVN